MATWAFEFVSFRQTNNCAASECLPSVVYNYGLLPSDFKVLNVTCDCCAIHDMAQGSSFVAFPLISHGQSHVEKLQSCMEEVLQQNPKP